MEKTLKSLQGYLGSKCADEVVGRKALQRFFDSSAAFKLLSEYRAWAMKVSASQMQEMIYAYMKKNLAQRLEHCEGTILGSH